MCDKELFGKFSIEIAQYSCKTKECKNVTMRYLRNRLIEMGSIKVKTVFIPNSAKLISSLENEGSSEIAE